jgi:O-antigen/teichoic acid export membrane protein
MNRPLRIRSVKFNAIMNVMLMASNTIVGLVTLPYVTCILSVEGYGAVGFAQNTAGWFSTFCILGISIYGIRECAKVRDDQALLAKTVKELLILLTIFTAIVLTIFASCIILIPRFQYDSILLWIFLSIRLSLHMDLNGYIRLWNNIPILRFEVECLSY